MNYPLAQVKTRVLKPREAIQTLKSSRLRRGVGDQARRKGKGRDIRVIILARESNYPPKFRQCAKGIQICQKQ
jgi:hypothetical protein